MSGTCVSWQVLVAAQLDQCCGPVIALHACYRDHVLQPHGHFGENLQARHERAEAVCLIVLHNIKENASVTGQTATALQLLVLLHSLQCTAMHAQSVKQRSRLESNAASMHSH